MGFKFVASIDITGGGGGGRATAVDETGVEELEIERGRGFCGMLVVAIVLLLLIASVEAIGCGAD